VMPTRDPRRAPAHRPRRRLPLPLDRAIIPTHKQWPHVVRKDSRDKARRS
jgi:hypothetical protein